MYILYTVVKHINIILLLIVDQRIHSTTMADCITMDPTQSDTGHSPKSLPIHSPVMLPPCRICSEKASGFHYGVNTCEACKVGIEVGCRSVGKKVKCFVVAIVISGKGFCRRMVFPRWFCPRGVMSISHRG